MDAERQTPMAIIAFDLLTVDDYLLHAEFEPA